MKKKAPQIHKTDELLKVAEDPTINTSDNIINYKNDILTFIATFDIQPGEDKIKKTTLFSIYKVWSKNAIKRNEFHLELGKFLPITKMRLTQGYKINQNAIKLTHSAYKEFQKESNKLLSKHWTKHFQNFLDLYKVKPGEFWIEDSILYFIYDKYNHQMGLDKSNNTALSEKTFYSYSDVYLPYKITRFGKVYGVTPNIQAQFQPDQLERMQTAYAQKAIKKK